MDQLVLVVDGWPWSPHLGLLSVLAAWQPASSSRARAAEGQMEATPCHLSRVCRHREQLVPRGRRLHTGVSSVARRPEGRYGLNCDP